MLLWLREVVQPHTRSQSAALLLDSYRAHFTPAVIAAADAINLQLIQVPGGTTSELQPLDLNVNGALLMQRRRLWSHLKLVNPFASDTLQAAVERAQLAYQSISKATVVGALEKAHLL